MKKQNILSIALAIIAVIALVFGIVFNGQKGGLQKQANELTSKIESLNQEIASTKEAAEAAAKSAQEELEAVKKDAEEAAAKAADEAAKAAEEALKKAEEEAAAKAAEEEAAQKTDETASADDQVVATVNGTRLYMSELQEAYNYYTGQGYDVTYSQILDIIIQTQLLKEVIAEGGFNQFTDEEKAGFQAEAATSWENAIQNYVTNYLTEDTEEARAQLRTQAEQYFNSMGYSQDTLAQSLSEQEAQNRYLASLASADSVTREEVQAYLENVAASEKAEINGQVDMYELYQMYMGHEFMYTPEGYRRVLHILMRLDDKVMTAYQTATAALEEITPKAIEEGEEAAEDVNEPQETAEAEEQGPVQEAAETQAPATTQEPEADPLEEIRTALDDMLIDGNEAMKAEYDKAVALLEQMKANNAADYAADMKKALDAIAIASLQKTVDEIENRLDSGEEFAAVAKEYNEDPGLDYTEGYLVHPESIMWDPAFRDAAFSEEMAKPGDHSKPVMGSYGVHILYYMADVPGGTAELTDELYAELAETLLEDKRYDIAEKAITEKEATAEIVKETAVIAELEGAASEVSIDFADGADDTEETVEAPADGEQN